MDCFDDIQCEEVYGEEWDGDETVWEGETDDAYVLASAGMGTDEDYGAFNDEDLWPEA
jgi:hypothetical protein